MNRDVDNTKENVLLDIIRVIMACMIPFLHIPNDDSGIIIRLIEVYVSRLGVPFFFAVSGYFLYISAEKMGNKEAFIKFAKRAGTLLVIWSIAYLPFTIRSFSFREYLFKTPYFLWYLTAALVGGFLVFLTKKFGWMKQLIIASTVYLVGTLFGESYDWLFQSPIRNIYRMHFLTTRNGVFFAFPLMVMGGGLHEYNLKGKRLLLFSIVVSAVYIGEMWFVNIMNADPTLDYSMVITLPLVVISIIMTCVGYGNIFNQNEAIGIKLRTISSAVYLMQFGVIYVSERIMSVTEIGVGTTLYFMVILVTVIALPSFFVIVFRRLSKIIF